MPGRGCDAGGRDRSPGGGNRSTGRSRPEDGARRGDATTPALADAYRRHAFEYLRRERPDDPVPVGDLAREVVARRAGKPRGAVSLDEQKRMYTALERTHLPELDDAGLVDLDPAEDTVAFAGERES